MAREHSVNRFWAARRERWRKVVAAWSHSGLSQAEYCRRENLHLATFNGWKQRLGKAAPETAGPDPFVAVRVQAAEERPEDARRSADVQPLDVVPLIEVVLRNGRTLRMGANIAADALSRLAAALEN